MTCSGCSRPEAAGVVNVERKGIDEAPIFCPSCGAPRTWDRLDGSVAYYCTCPGYGAGAHSSLPLTTSRGPVDDFDRQASEMPQDHTMGDP